MINSEYNEPKDYTSFKVLESNRSKALFCGADCHIFLETSTPFYREICDFLVAIAEPVHRTRNIHEYILTKYSAKIIKISLQKLISTTILNISNY